jgi:hypothetical protein
MIVKNFKELRKKWEEDIKKKEGKEYLKKYKKSLDGQWEYLVSQGFILEDPELEEE